MKTCPKCSYQNNRDNARRCGKCRKPFPPITILDGGSTMSPTPKDGLIVQGNNVGMDLNLLFDGLLQVAETYEGQELSWRIGGRHIKVYELRRKIKKVQSDLEDEVLENYKALISAQIHERTQKQILRHQENITRAHQEYKVETETAKIVLEINMIADALESLNEVTKRMHGIDEEVKQRFIEDFFIHLKEKVFNPKMEESSKK